MSDTPTRAEPFDQHNDRFRLVVEAAPNAMIMIDRAGLITLINAQSEKLFGYHRDELIGHSVEILVPQRNRHHHPDLRTGYFKDPHIRSMGSGRDLYGLTKDGREVPIEIGLNPIETDEGTFVLAAIIDITERKRSEERINLVVEAAPNAMVMINGAGLITLVNAQTEKLFGYPRSDLIGKPVELLIPQRNRPDHPKLRNSYFGNPEPRSMGVGRDLFGLTRDGREVPIEIGLNPIETSEGTFVLAAIIDITERKFAENAIRQSETRFREMVSSVKEYAIFTLDTDGRIASWNAGAQRFKGYTEEEIVGCHFSVFYPAEDLAADKPGRELREAIEHGQAADQGWRLRKDGSRFWADVIVTAMRDERGALTGFSKVSRDMTQRKQDEEALNELNQSLRIQVNETAQALTRLRDAQNQLVQAEKLASLGELVAGVAHEVNTPIGVAVTAASTLQWRATELRELYESGNLTEDDLEQFVHLSTDAAELLLSHLRRAADLVQSFKQVAVDQSSSERRRFDLATYINEVLLSLAPKLKQTKHQIKVDCPPSIIVDSYPGALFQVLTNLVGNSLVHAFAEGHKGNIRISASQEADSIILYYSDDGAGIAKENLRRIFEPFFTTKRGTGGSGLGLNIVHNLVTQIFGGSITAKSTVGGGAEFRIEFPRVAPATTSNRTVS